MNNPLTWKEMAGDTYLEKKLNYYLTFQFVTSNNPPADECLKEAREVIKMVLEDAGVP